MARRPMMSHEHVMALAVLRDLGSERIDAIATGLPKAMLHPTELVAALENEGIDEHQGVARLLMSLASLGRKPMPHVLDDVRLALENHQWTTEELEVWAQVRPALLRLLDSPGLLTLTKALQLQYDHTNILAETHIVTDVRPVFNRDGSVPLAMLVCHTLRVAYRSEGQSRHLTLALDTPDLERLKDDVERALTKAATMKRYLAEPNPLKSRIAGGDDGA